MTQHSFTLIDGMRIGDELHQKCTVKEPSAGDILDAQQDAERLMATPSGYTLVISDAVLGFHLARRQITAIGELQGPITEKEMRLLSARDLNQIQQELNHLDQAVLKELEERGRNESPAKTR